MPVRSNMQKNSRQKSSDKILGVITARKAERVLLDWVNLPSVAEGVDSDKYEQILQHHSDVFTLEDTRAEAQKAWRQELNRALQTGQACLRRVWDAPDPRRRDWHIFVLRGLYQDSQRRVLAPVRGVFTSMRDAHDFLPDVPAVTPVEAALFYLQSRLAHRMLHCPNPTCAAPYFFKTKKVQKYCSPECADPARREAKRIWWNQNRGKGARF